MFLFILVWGVLYARNKFDVYFIDGQVLENVFPILRNDLLLTETVTLRQPCPEVVRVLQPRPPSTSFCGAKSRRIETNCSLMHEPRRPDAQAFNASKISGIDFSFGGRSFFEIHHYFEIDLIIIFEIHHFVWQQL